jgi:hypothetical protein
MRSIYARRIGQCVRFGEGGFSGYAAPLQLQ